MATSGYRGRFAPSPTGPLHFGSLLAALASFLDARHADGEWLLRVEDIDPPREAPGASDAILNSLQRHGLQWDGPATFQSARSALYEESLADLRRQGLLFPCSCTRAVLGPGGVCGRRCSPTADTPTALRIELHGDKQYDDFLLGPRQAAVPVDQVLKRKDGLYAYALAVVADDADQGITHVLRGHDLLEQTSAQIRLHQHLGNTTPIFGHIPLLCDAQGTKLSKQTGAQALDNDRALENLKLALRYLGQPEHHSDTIPMLLEAATGSWSRAAVASAARQTLRYPPPVGP